MSTQLLTTLTPDNDHVQGTGGNVNLTTKNAPFEVHTNANTTLTGALTDIAQPMTITVKSGHTLTFEGATIKNNSAYYPTRTQSYASANHNTNGFGSNIRGIITINASGTNDNKIVFHALRSCWCDDGNGAAYL